MLLKSKIEDLTDNIKEFHKFIEEASKNYEDTNIRMSVMQKDFDTLSTESKILKHTINQGIKRGSPQDNLYLPRTEAQVA